MLKKSEINDLSYALDVLLLPDSASQDSEWDTVFNALVTLNAICFIELLNQLAELDESNVHRKLFAVLHLGSATDHQEVVTLSTQHLNRAIDAIRVAKTLSYELLDGVPPSPVVRVS